MLKNLLIILAIALALGITIIVGGLITNQTPSSIISPYVAVIEKKADNLESVFKQKEVNPYPLGNPINVLLLGIDRRNRDEAGYRTDIMIMLSVNPQTNRVTLTSIPRDLWYKNTRINAIFLRDGFEGMQEAMETITGEKPQKFILTDFKDFEWIVDAMGGVPVEVETTFTDTHYPVDETKEYQTIAFNKGAEILTGKRALIFSRSRKGDYDSGDWGRMKRQHLILKGMLKAVLQPTSLFNPMVVENAFRTVTTNKMDTNLNVMDAKYLWDFYKDKDKYQLISLYLNSDYLYTPPQEDYGGAWVLVAKNDSFEEFKQLVHQKLYALPELQKDTLNMPTTQNESAL